MFEKLIGKLNEIIAKVGDMKKQCCEKEDRVKELEQNVAEKENEINELKAHGEIVNEEMLMLMEEINVLRNKTVDEDGLAELENLMNILEDILED